MSTAWQVPKDALEGACKIISNVPPRNGIKSSEYIKVSKAGKDGAYFMLTSDLLSRALIRTGEEFPFTDEFFLDRRLFLPFIEAGMETKSSSYEFIVKEDGKLIVKHGNRRAQYERLKPVSGYEDVPDIAKAKSASIDKRWIDLVDVAHDCATDDPITPHLNCVYINPRKKHLEVYSSNGLVIFRGRTDSQKTLTEAIAFPLLLIDSLRLDNATKMLWTSKVALVEFPKGKIWQAVKIQARKNFPVTDVLKLMQEAESDEVVLSVNSSVLSSIANRISTYVAALSRDVLTFAIKLEKGSRKVVISSGVDMSFFQETLTMNLPASRDVLLEWPLDQVMPVLIYCKDDGIAKVRVSKDGKSSYHSKTVSLIVAKPTKVAKKKAQKISKQEGK